MRNIRIYILAVISLLAVSCEDFLNINPKAEIVNDDLFSTAEGCENALAGIYGYLDNNSLYGKEFNCFVTDVLAQDLSAPDANFYRDIEVYSYDVTSSTISTIKDMWSEPYIVIGYANNIIENVEAFPSGKFPQQDRYLGEAYGIRALMHFELVKLFAPHVEKSPNEEAIPYMYKYSYDEIPFSTVKEVYDNIVADLKKAQELMRNFDITDDYYRLRFNYHAATAYLARVYWMMGEYSLARTEAMKLIGVIQHAGTDYESNFFEIETRDNVANMLRGFVSNREVIYGVFSLSIYATYYDAFYTSSSWQSFQPYQEESGSAQLLQTYQQIYGKDLGGNSGADMRMSGWFGRIGTGEDFNLLKHVDIERAEGGDIGDEVGNVSDHLEGTTLIRLSEMYYIIAEAYVREGNTTEAATYINHILTNRGLTKLEERIPAIEPTVDLIYNERHKEFYGEGMRWFDMKKLNLDILSNTEYKTLPASDKIYVLPIPIEEFDFRNLD